MIGIFFDSGSWIIDHFLKDKGSISVPKLSLAYELLGFHVVL